MAKPDNVGQGNARGKGLDKEHLVRDAEGNERTMTQREWMDRDKDAGLERVDVPELAEEPAVEEPVVEEGTTEE